MRFVRGFGALLVLTAALVGIPLALAAFGGNPLPDSLAWVDIQRALLAPASDRVLIGLFTLVGWVAWAGFAASVAAEAVNAASRLRGSRIQLKLPGLAVGQKAAAVLVLAVVAMLATPQALTTTAAADPAPTPSPTRTVAVVPHTGPTSPADQRVSNHADDERTESRTTAAAPPAAAPRAERPPAAAPDTKASLVSHVVERGDYLWTLADRYLGDGAKWREIADANPGIDPEQLRVGQRIVIPLADQKPAKAGAGADHGTVKVQAGDNLSTISDDLYGTEERWTDIYDANRGQIEDPDLIDTGQVLQLPAPATEEDPDHDVSGGGADRDTEPDRGGADQDRPDRGQTDADPDGDGRQPPQTQPTERPRTEPEPTSVPSASATPPATSAPSVQPPQQAEPEPAPVETPTDEDETAEPAPAGVAVGLLLAAGLVTAVQLRRRRQMQARRPGRRVPPPAPDAHHLEVEVKGQHQPLRVEQLDHIMRAISAHCHRLGRDVPALTAVRVSDQRIDLLLRRPAEQPPPGVDAIADGSVWTLHAGNADALLAIEGLDDAAPPYPALVTIGRDADTAHLLINLEAAGALTLTAADPRQAKAMLTTVALELAVSPWSADLHVTLVGPVCPGLAEALDNPAVTHVDDVDRVIDGLEVRAQQQRVHLHDDSSVGQKRANPQLADAWCPHVVLLGDPLNSEQVDRLKQVVTDLPRVAITAVTTTIPAITDWQLTITADGAGADLEPHGWRLTPQLVSEEQYQATLSLIAAVGSDETLPAPWWDHDAAATGPSTATVTELSSRTRKPAPAEPDPVERDAAAAEGGHAGASAAAAPRTSPHTGVAKAERTPRPLTLRNLVGGPSADAALDERGPAITARERLLEPDDLVQPEPTHPMLRILGRPEIAGARGISNRNQQRCMEVMLYLLEHPSGTNTQHLANTLYLSRETAKSVIAYLRKWLGADDDGHPYLPDYTSRGYRLDDRVTSDWHRTRLLIGRGVNTAASENLVRILQMVRGPVLDGAEEWADTEALRPDLTCAVVDAAHELCHRALSEGDLRLARWATARGLRVQPDSEVLLTDLLRAEGRDGNRPEVQRLANRISGNARALGVDLADDTVEALHATANL